jgi:ornithine--oxo-acid transaminase
VFTPGDHGSTFGGNPLACAVGLAALDLLVGENLAQRAAEMGAYFLDQLRRMDSPLIREVRGKGLLIGVEIGQGETTADDLALRLQDEGILTKAVHASVLRFAPPLIISQRQIDQAMKAIRRAFR